MRLKLKKEEKGDSSFYIRTCICLSNIFYNKKLHWKSA